MIGLIQLEIGEYELSLKISYEKCGFLAWKKHQVAQSRIYFTVDQAGLEVYKNALVNTLIGSASNIVRGTNDTVNYAVYQPKRFSETGRQGIKRSDKLIG